VAFFLAKSLAGICIFGHKKRELAALFWHPVYGQNKNRVALGVDFKAQICFHSLFIFIAA